MYKSFQELKQAMENEGSVMPVKMRDLLGASTSGALRCSTNNIQKIKDELDEFGLGYHFPSNASINQNTVIHIIKLSEDPVKQKLSKEERFGGRWNDFGSPPDEQEYAIAQLYNARASRDYGVVHGRSHPYSITAKESYEKAVERCFVREQQVFEVYQKTGAKLPKYVRFEYFNYKGIPQDLVDGAPEGTSAIEGYKIKGFGKAEYGKGVVLPVNLKFSS